MAIIFYARVSTIEQTIAHQRTSAEAAGYVFDEVVADDGVSGVTTALREREGGRRLFDLLRAGDTLVVRWVDRLGRNYEDVCGVLREFMRRGVVVKTIINGMTFDGAAKTDVDKAVRDALIGFMAAMSAAQAEAIREAQKAGIAYAKTSAEDKYLGRKPTYTETHISEVLRLRGEDMGATDIAKMLGISRQAVYRIQKNPDEAFASVRAWG